MGLVEIQAFPGVCLQLLPASILLDSFLPKHGPLPPLQGLGLSAALFVRLPESGKGCPTSRYPDHHLSFPDSYSSEVTVW